MPAGERTVARVVDVVETLAEFDDASVSAASLDDRVSQNASQKVNIDRGHADRLGVLTRSTRFELSAYFVNREVPLQQGGALVRVRRQLEFRETGKVIVATHVRQ